jgi:hypothetical protein
MPELGGEALVAELERHQRVPLVLFISGSGEGDMSHLPGPVLQKPFTIPQLKGRVRELLEPPRSDRQAAPAPQGAS